MHFTYRSPQGNPVPLFQSMPPNLTSLDVSGRVRTPEDLVNIAELIETNKTLKILKLTVAPPFSFPFFPVIDRLLCRVDLWRVNDAEKQCSDSLRLFQIINPWFLCGYIQIIPVQG